MRQPKRYNLDKDIIRLKVELAHIIELRETLKTHGWGKVVEAFQKTINKFMNDVFEKCDKPEKNALEIRCKKMVADALGEVVYALDRRVANEQNVRHDLEDKLATKADIKDRQKLQQIG